MYLEIALGSEVPVELPIHYVHIVQSTIYALLDPEISNFLHESGYMAGGRTFRLFCFSRLEGKYEIRKDVGKIVYTGPIKLTVSSPVNRFIQSLANGLLREGNCRLGKHLLKVVEVKVNDHQVVGKQLSVRTLGPVVVYSTLLRPDGRKYTCYLQPGEPDYDRLITDNLRKKYLALYNREAPAGLVTVRTPRQPKLNIVKYKETIIKGYSGTFDLQGPRELLQIAIECGLGSKNSQGFGTCRPLVKEVKLDGLSSRSKVSRDAG